MGMCVCVWMNSPVPINVPIRDTWSLPLICMCIHINWSKDACVYVCGPVTIHDRICGETHTKSAHAIQPGCECCYAQWPVQTGSSDQVVVRHCSIRARGSTLCPCFSVAHHFWTSCVRCIAGQFGLEQEASTHPLLSVAQCSVHCRCGSESWSSYRLSCTIEHRHQQNVANKWTPWLVTPVPSADVLWDWPLTECLLWLCKSTRWGYDTIAAHHLILPYTTRVWLSLMMKIIFFNS